jgi:peroxiredoxin
LIEPGERAPDFTLTSHAGDQVSLSDYRGRKLLLIFYPLDFSPVCTDQLTTYQEVLPELEARGVTPLGISVDSSWTHRAFRKTLGMEIDLLADFEPKGEVARSYGAYLAPAGHSNRSLVLIDEEGIVEWVHEAEHPGVVPESGLIRDALNEEAEPRRAAGLDGG